MPSGLLGIWLVQLIFATRLVFKKQSWRILTLFWVKNLFFRFSEHCPSIIELDSDKMFAWDALQKWVKFFVSLALLENRNNCQIKMLVLLIIHPWKNYAFNVQLMDMTTYKLVWHRDIISTIYLIKILELLNLLLYDWRKLLSLLT